MTKRTKEMIKATSNISVKACLYSTAINGGKLYIEKERKAYKKGGKIRKALSVLNIAVLLTGIYQAINYGQNISAEYCEELTNIMEGDTDNNNLDDNQIQ